jgi:fucose permease
MGIEVSIGGWATTFLLEERGGDDRSGYVTSGYFGGLTVGMSLRVIPWPATSKLVSPHGAGGMNAN